MNTQTPIDITTNEPTSITTVVLPTVVTPAMKPFFSGRMPLPPSLDKAYQVIIYKGGRRIGPTADLDQFKADAALMLSQAYHDWSLINAIRSSRIHTPLAVELRIYFRTMWKSDVDNRIKFAIDAAFERMQLNDNLVVDMHVTKETDAIEPRVEIEVSVVVD